MSAFDFIDIINKTFNDSIKMSIFQKIKTGNTLIDAILATISFSIISYILKYIYDNNSFYNPWNIDIHDAIKSLFFKKYSIIFEGKRCSAISYHSYPIISSCFTDSFKALWDDIINNINNNKTIYEIKEFCASLDNDKYSNKCNEKYDLYIVSQKKAFLYNAELKIYAITEIISEDLHADKEKPATKTDKISITLYSYVTNTNEIKNYVKKIKENYLESIEQSRNSKKFIYTLIKTKYEDDKDECWSEYPFDSTRTFKNIFFENQEQVIKKINFFLENKEWYYEMGIPYSLGIGLHGPPGTGKTSFFKCLANMTKRHLIILSLKLIKTRRQLDDFFFENRYNSNNKAHSIGFDKKIIIIEDIDCLGEIVWKREYNKKTGKIGKIGKNGKTINLTSLSQTSSVNVADVIQSFVDANEEQNKILTTVAKPLEEDPITLDDILNLWDGLKETPGRILGISSNHYDKLDPALVRPGRIDITLKLDNASRDIIRQMYERYYSRSIDEKKLKKINDKFYSPAEIINCYIMNKDNPNAFMSRLIKNKKF